MGKEIKEGTYVCLKEGTKKSRKLRRKEGGKEGITQDGR
jgi:hypothetical protein